MTPAVFAHGDLRLYLLSLLAEHPRHGYELIQDLGERFGGTYSPSAGTIYPRLAKLEQEGMVTKSRLGRKRVYDITDAGRAELAARAGELGDIENQVTDTVRRLADEVRSGVNDAMRSLRAELASAAREATRPQPRASGARTDTTETDAGDIRSREHSRAVLREVDAALTDFRQRMRTELRERAAVEPLPDDLVARLHEELARTRDSIRALPPRR